MSSPDYTVRDLRRRWQPTKERLAGIPRYQPILIRIHRSTSWLQRVEEIAESGATDAMLIFQWVALNSLYGRWDPKAREPVNDRKSLTALLEAVLILDGDERVATTLKDHRRLVMTILEDEYLSKFFWEEPTAERARKSKKAKFDASTWYLEGRYGMILQRLLERIYLLRCQLVHGAATFGGRLNRTAIKRCSIMLGHLLPALLLVIIDHGYEEDWGPLCYPPHGGT